MSTLAWVPSQPRPAKAACTACTHTQLGSPLQLCLRFLGPQRTTRLQHVHARGHSIQTAPASNAAAASQHPDTYQRRHHDLGLAGRLTPCMEGGAQEGSAARACCRRARAAGLSASATRSASAASPVSAAGRASSAASARGRPSSHAAAASTGRSCSTWRAAGRGVGAALRPAQEPSSRVRLQPGRVSKLGA